MDICTVSTNTIHNKVIARKTSGLIWANVIKVTDQNVIIKEPKKIRAVNFGGKISTDKTMPLIYKFHYSYTAAKNSVQIYIYIYHSESKDLRNLV